MNVCKPLPKTLSQCWEWYKTTQDQLTEFIQQTVTQMFADDPSLLYPKGVTDGSAAAAGMPGEIWTASASGNWAGGGSNTVAPQANFVVPNAPLPAGDWNITWQLVLQSVGNAGVGAALMRLSAPLPAGALNNLSGYAVNIPTNMAPASDGGLQPLVMTGPTVPINLASAQGLVFNLFIWPSGVLSGGPYTFNVWARRVR